MRWLIFSLEQTALVKQCSELLELAGQIVLHEQYYEKTSLNEIKEKLISDKPDRIIIIISNEQQTRTDSPLVETLNNQLLIPVYICQVTADFYSTVPVLLLTFTDENNQSDPFSSVNIIQKATDELVQLYSPIIKQVLISYDKYKDIFLFYLSSSARIFTPITDEDFNEIYLLKTLQRLCRKNADESHHITILSDLLPILLALIHDGKVSGQIDVCNKGTISLSWFEQILSKKNQIHTNETDNLTDKFDDWNKQMISPETRHLYRASFVLPNIRTTIEEYLRQKSIEIDPNSPRTLLVTGGCGFIGSTFINYWLETYPQDRIVNIDRLDPISNTKNIANPQSFNYSLIIADINNKDIVLHLMRQYNITHIVHFAGRILFISFC